MRTKNHRRATSIGEQLQAVDSAESLHEILTALARENSRWTRTQVLHYLPKQFHSRAASHFDGERWHATDDQPRLADAVDKIDLDEILRQINSRSEAIFAVASSHVESSGIESSRIASAEQVANLPPYSGPGAEHAAVSGMIRALRDEIEEVNHRTPKQFKLRDGVCVDGSAGRFTYQFTWSSEPDPHMPGTLVVGNQQVPARIGVQSPDSVTRFTVDTDVYLGAQIPIARFWIDPTFLLTVAHEQLLHELKTRQDNVVTHIERLMSPPAQHVVGTHLRISEAKLNAEQRTAVATGLSSDRSYIWGPPGTGKTTTLGSLVAALVTDGKRVLVVSPYNVAVDAAAISALRPSYHKGAVVRIGRIGEDVRRHGIDLDSHLERIAAENGTLLIARQLLAALMTNSDQVRRPPLSVRACLDELGAIVVQSRASSEDPKMGKLVLAIAEIRKLFRAPEGRMLSEARVVASTIALHMVLPMLREQRFDHVIVDEASVVRPPDAALLSLRVHAPLTFFGDPKQLPPIVVSSSEAARLWLGRNPFSLAGIRGPDDATGACVLLEEQHRMSPTIRSLVSDLFYEGRLRDGERAPKSGQIVLVDTSKTPARATSRMIKLSTSKENQLHRAIVSDVVRAIVADEPNVGVLVISPFVAQTRAYRREPTSSRLTQGIRFETIHASQGSERDIVVLDLVLAGSLTGTGRSRMFDDERNPHLLNLLNVAISRAKRRLVIVGQQALLQSSYRYGLLNVLWHAAAARGTAIEVPRDLMCRDLYRATFRLK